MSKAPNQLDAPRLAREHDELTVMIKDLQSWLADVAELGIPHFGELSSRLQPLHDKLCEHFAHEEEEGVLTHAGAAAPDISGEARELRAEHEGFMDRLDALIRRLRDSETPFDSWQTACEMFESLCADLARHEQREMSLQVGGGDGPASSSQSEPKT